MTPSKRFFYALTYLEAEAYVQILSVFCEAWNRSQIWAEFPPSKSQLNQNSLMQTSPNFMGAKDVLIQILQFAPISA